MRTCFHGWQTPSVFALKKMPWDIHSAGWDTGFGHCMSLHLTSPAHSTVGPSVPCSTGLSVISVACAFCTKRLLNYTFYAIVQKQQTRFKGGSSIVQYVLNIHPLDSNRSRVSSFMMNQFIYSCIDHSRSPGCFFRPVAVLKEIINPTKTSI